MSKISKRAAIKQPSVEEDKAINDAAKADPDAQPLSDEQLDAMVPMRSLRGRPKSNNRKVLVSVRYSQEVIDYFRSTGDGWQSRMDGVLRRYVERQARASQK